MAETNIEWADRVWNPTRGCSRVSAGCDHCYAIRQARRSDRPGGAYEGLTRARADGSIDWSGQVRFVPEKLREPLAWRNPSRVFVDSMSDLFHPSLLWSQIEPVFDVMQEAERHTFQILTKRPDHMQQFAEFWAFHHGGPLPNVWLGVSVEDQKTADERIPLLLQTPAAVRFLSYEPALGPVDFSKWIEKTSTRHLSVSVRGALRNRSFDGYQYSDGRPMTKSEAQEELMSLLSSGIELIPLGECDGFSPQDGCPGHRNQRIDWLIVGGESGPGARPCDVEWIRNTKDQCQQAGVAVFVKQLGTVIEHDDPDSWEEDEAPWPDGTVVEDGCTPRVRLKSHKGGDPSEWPEDLRVREFPKP